MIAGLNEQVPTLWADASGVPHTLDQRFLPFERREIALRTCADCACAIREMQVRGAPLIGAVAAWGLALAIAVDASDSAVAAATEFLAATRPTAVNLRWALGRVRRRVDPAPPGQRAALARAEAQAICDEDLAVNLRIGAHGAAALRAHVRAGRLDLLTHCNAGGLATIGYGTALAPVYRLHDEGLPVHVWVDETRPRNQGALTAMELAGHGVAHTFIVDNAGGWLMREGRVDAVIVGCDRVAANGDVANKIGTYLKALAARDNGIPFYVACPLSSIDPSIGDGASIPVEERDVDEVTHVTGVLEACPPEGDDRASGRPEDDAASAIRPAEAAASTPRRARVRVLAAGSPVANPGFDVTPARLVTALITERGVCEASPRAIAALLRGAAGALPAAAAASPHTGAARGRGRS